MDNKPFEPEGDEWYLYKDGSLFKRLPKALFTKEEIISIWKGRYPDSSIFVI